MVLEQDCIQIFFNDSCVKVVVLCISLVCLCVEVYGQLLVFDLDFLEYKEYVVNQKDFYVKCKVLIDQDLQVLYDMFDFLLIMLLVWCIIVVVVGKFGKFVKVVQLGKEYMDVVQDDL